MTPQMDEYICESLQHIRELLEEIRDAVQCQSECDAGDLSGTLTAILEAVQGADKP